MTKMMNKDFDQVFFSPENKNILLPWFLTTPIRKNLTSYREVGFVYAKQMNKKIIHYG